MEGTDCKSALAGGKERPILRFLSDEMKQLESVKGLNGLEVLDNVNIFSIHFWNVPRSNKTVRLEPNWRIEF